SIFDIALEIYDCDGDDTIVTHSSEVWDNILSLTRKANKSKILDGTRSEDGGIDAKFDALASLLNGAVSHPDIQLRGEYVGRITRMPNKETQKSLMDMIARQKQEIEGNRQEKRTKRFHTVHEKTNTPGRHISKSCVPRAQKSPCTLISCRSKPRQTDGIAGRSLFTTPQRAPNSNGYSVMEEKSKMLCFSSPGLGDTAEYEKEVEGLREQNDHLLSTLERYKRNEEEMKSKHEKMESKYRNEMMKIEAASCHRNEEVQGELQGKIKRLEDDLSEMAKRLEASEDAKAELDTIKDEMELTKHTKSLLDDATERLNNYKEKLAQLTDVMDALEKEEEAHSRSVDENIRLKNEISSLYSMKRNLDEYKSRAVEAEVRFTEVHDEMTKLQKQLRDSTNDHENLQTMIRSQKEEIENLYRQIKHEETTENCGGRLGVGISEHNPQIKEELLRLRNENTQLRDFANKREDDAVTKMELQVEDTRRLAERYKNQFLSTKGRLQTTESDLEESISREQKLQGDYAKAIEESNRMHLQLQELNLELTNIHQNLDASRTRESILEEELSSWVGQARALQEQTDEMTSRLHSCKKNLEKAQTQKAVLLDEIAGLEQKLERCNQQASSLSCQFEEQRKELRDSNEHGEELSQDLSEWIDKAKSASDLAIEISDNLASCATELQMSKCNNILLQQKLDAVSAVAHSSRLELKETQKKLRGVYGDLEQKNAFIKSAKQREQTVLSDLQSAKKQVDDTVLMLGEKTATITELEDKVEEALEEKKILLAREESVMAERNELHENVQQMEKKIAFIQREADSCNGGKIEALRALQTSEEERRSIDLHVAKIERALEVSQVNGEVYLQQTHMLESELVDTKEHLLSMTASLENLTKTETEVKEQLREAHCMISDLQEKVNKEQRIRATADNKTALLLDKNSKMEADMQASIEEMRIKWQEQMQIAADCRLEIDRLNEVLSATNHRENMLQHKIRMLEDKESELAAVIEVTRERATTEAMEATKSFEATCEILNSNATKDIENLQNKMNLLLEDERREQRQIEAESKEKMKQLKEKMEIEVANTKDKAASAIEKTQNEARVRCHQMQKQHEEIVLKMKEDANQESAQLVRKGKSMLKELMIKQREERGKLENKVSILEEKCNMLLHEMESTTSECNAKVREYRKKLKLASVRLTRLTTESDDLEGQLETLSHESSKLQEENDRYRRQLGGRFGAESNVQNEMLRKELKSACDEILQLKRQRGESLPSHTNNGFSEAHQNFHRDLASQSTISQLRSEYEETIEAISDEKRELVMRNSAAITDVQKAEMRAWETEQDNAALKEELVSLRLQVERMEKPCLEDHSLVNVDNLDIPTSESAPLPESGTQNFDQQDEIQNDSNVTNDDSSLPSTEFPMEFQHHGSSAQHEERPPECTQS
ncbi:MAG: hypothetical protein SGBAC_010319, partial [Bacillariaceae sp.]